MPMAGTRRQRPTGHQSVRAEASAVSGRPWDRASALRSMSENQVFPHFGYPTTHDGAPRSVRAADAMAILTGGREMPTTASASAVPPHDTDDTSLPISP